MVNKELLDYIKSVREKGVTDDAIKAHLLKYNYSQDIIEDALKELGSSTPSSKEEKQQIKKPITSVVYLGLGVLILGIVAAAFFIFGKDLITLDFLSSSSQCEQVSLAVYNINNEPVLCFYPDNSKVQVIMENKGQENIPNVEITIKGQKGSFKDELSNLNLNPNDVFPRTVIYNYTKYGEIREVSLLPSIVIEGEEKKCINKRISFSELKTC